MINFAGGSLLAEHFKLQREFDSILAMNTYDEHKAELIDELIAKIDDLDRRNERSHLKVMK